ncbi:PGF-CTERM sorting domain-containing protein [Halogeometricum borinquense]|uniref:PGF-CTERM sorting domain-containing protein n=1 Tax=Halogeometricum borinquense TaxID=60847 RepID=A0A482TN21_9EURY|nr:BGTF surface domain-containing protein [Halogeometricum borinquense]RYJ14611.1 PGF-CTERM sorting domain-containing protein [Halogeometricum borinquense]
MTERPPTETDAQPSRRRIGATLLLTAFVALAAVVAPVAAASDAFSPTEDSTTFYPTDDQTVSGETTLEPGTELLVYLRSNNGEYRFSKEARANVTEDGTYEAAFNLSSVPDNASTSVNVTLRHATDPDGPETTYAGELRPAAEQPKTTTESSSTGIPGFGPVVGLVGAALAAALFARRD